MGNEKSIAQEVMEVQALIKDVNKAVQALVSHPGFIRVTEFGEMLERFATGQAAMNTHAPAKTRTRRTKAEIEAAKTNGENKGG